jgi:hypothetical protein
MKPRPDETQFGPISVGNRSVYRMSHRRLGARCERNVRPVVGRILMAPQVAPSLGHENRLIRIIETTDLLLTARVSRGYLANSVALRASHTLVSQLSRCRLLLEQASRCLVRS